MSDTTTADEAIQDLEEEIRTKQEELAQLRLRQPPQPVGEHLLDAPDGAKVALADLFGDKQDLIVIHNMGKGCPYCTLWADGFNGLIHHLENRAALALVSPDTPEVQQAFAESRGWKFRMLSNGDSGFTEAMGYVKEHEGETWVLPGYSTFRRRKDGSIVRIAHAPFGPGDPYCGLWHLFALLDGGAGEWQPKIAYA